MPAQWRRFGRNPAGAGAIAALCIASIALGGPTGDPYLTMTWDASNDGVGPEEYSWYEHGTLNPFGLYTIDPLMIGDTQDPGSMTPIPGSGVSALGWNYAGQLQSQDNLWTYEWNCIFDDGSGPGAATGGLPFITANLVVTNADQINSQTFTLLMTLNVPRAIVNPLMNGSIVGTILDLTGDDATVSALGGSSIYEARIDFVDERSLMVDPFSASAGAPFFSGPVGPEDFGIPAPEVASQDVNTNIQIFLQFELSPGDSASFVSIFEIVPSPGGLAVLGLAGLAGRRRRRRA